MSIFNEKINSVTLASKDGYKPSDALNKFLIGSNGFFKQVESDIVVIRHKVDSVPELQDLKEGATVKIEKIPFKLFLKIRMFFKKIYQEFKTESTICVMQDLNTKEYSLFVPDQKTNITVTYTITTDKGTVDNTVGDVPVEKNFRTNIIGSLLTSKVDYTVELNDEWGGAEEKVEVKNPVIYIEGIPYLPLRQICELFGKS